MDKEQWDIRVDQDGCQAEVSVDIPSDDVEEYRKQAINEVSQEVDEPGFRQGNVPDGIIEEKYPGAVRQQLAEKVVPEAFQTIYEQHDVRPVDEPEIHDMDMDGNFSLEATVDTQPDFEVDSEDYEGMELERPAQEINEERVDEQIEDLRSEKADLEPIPITRPVQEGDFVTVDLQGYDDEGELIEGTSGDDVVVEVGAGRFLEDLEQGLVGLEEGTQARVGATFPDDFVEDSLAGEDVSFDVNIKSIQEERAPEVDDPEFLEEMDVDSVEELREEVRDGLQRADEETNEQHLQQQVYDNLLEQYDFPLPDSLVEQEIDSMLEQQKQQLRQQGRSFDEFLNEQGQTEDELRDELEEDAEQRIALTFILGRIASQEDVQVEDHEVQQHIEEMAAQYNMEPQQLRENFDDQMVSNIRFQLRDEKVVKYIVRNADVTEVDPDELEDNEPDEE